MGCCGGSDTKEQQPKTEEHKKLEKEHKEAQNQLEESRKEAEALRAEIKQKEHKSALAARRTEVEGGISFEVVITADQIAALQKIEGVGLFFMLGETEPMLERENIVIVTCKKDLVPKVLEEIQCPPDIQRDQKPVPDAPPPSMEKAAEKIEDSDEEDEVGEDGEKKEKKKKEEKPKEAVPEQTVEAETDIEMDVEAWDGAVPLKFRWVDEPSPFSEYNDPAGSNWNCFTNVRKAPGAPKKVQLELRQGMMGDWTTMEGVWDTELEDFVVHHTVKPEEVSGSEYRGFQSRWIVDGDKYLSPLQLAPTLQSKLMTYPAVRSAIKALPADKQSIDNIENEHMRKALMTVENIIPMNTWDVDYGVTKMPGAYLKGEHTATLSEKVEMIAKAKVNDPAIQSEVRKTILKSPIMGANAAAGTVGVKLDIIIKNMDFFLPKMTDPDYGKLKDVEQKTLQWETLRREMQVDVNELYPSFQNGIRVTFPPAHVIENAMMSKRPLANPDVLIPVNLKFKLEDDDVYIEKHKVQLVYWKDGEEYNDENKTVVDLDAIETTEKFGITREEKPVWRKYRKQVKLNHNVYRYYWLYDDQPYFNNGCPFTEKYIAGESYETFSVMLMVQFGIGVAF